MSELSPIHTVARSIIPTVLPGCRKYGFRLANKKITILKIQYSPKLQFNVKNLPRKYIEDDLIFRRIFVDIYYIRNYPQYPEDV